MGEAKISKIEGTQLGEAKIRAKKQLPTPGLCKINLPFDSSRTQKVTGSNKKGATLEQFLCVCSVKSRGGFSLRLNGDRRREGNEMWVFKSLSSLVSILSHHSVCFGWETAYIFYSFAAIFRELILQNWVNYTDFPWGFWQFHTPPKDFTHACQMLWLFFV